MPNKEGRWVTINGRAIFIGEGQSLEEALNSKGQVKKTAAGSKGKSGGPKKATAASIPQKYKGIYKIGEDDPDSYKTGDTVDGMKILASLDPKRDDDDEHPYAYMTDSKEHPVVTIVHDRVYDVELDDADVGGAQQKQGSAGTPKKAKSSDIPAAYRSAYKIGEDDPDSYKTGDTVDGMRILASLDPKDDDDDETPYAYLTDSKEHPVVTIVHDRVYDVEPPSRRPKWEW